MAFLKCFIKETFFNLEILATFWQVELEGHKKRDRMNLEAFNHEIDTILLYNGEKNSLHCKVCLVCD
jgi:hypothetical protein